MGERYGRGLAAAVVALALLGAIACDPVYEERPIDPLVGEVSSTSQLVPCAEAATTVTLTADAHLDPACTWTGGVRIRASNTTLDCRGATIERTEGSGGRGIEISAPVDLALTGVRVRNCVIKGPFTNSIRITRDGFRTLAAGAEYDHAFSDIVVEQSHLYRSTGSGIFVDAYVTGVTLRDLEIAGSGGVGIYLEAGSKGSTVERSTIYDNGYADTGPEGVPFTVNGVSARYIGTGREGIAIDGSRDNRIVGNRLARNAAGGIFLYKNCGEYVTQRPAQWWTRRYGADGNLIEGNTVTTGPTGIWVGSRLGQNQLFMDCSDPPYVHNALQAVVEDQADGNVVRGNTLRGFTHAIRVEDDGNQFLGNTIDVPVADGTAVLSGTTFRAQVLGRPTTGSVIAGNRATGAATSPYRWTAGTDRAGTTVSGNLAAGTAAGFVDGPAPATDPFLMVKTFWLDAGT